MCAQVQKVYTLNPAVSWKSLKTDQYVIYFGHYDMSGLIMNA